MTGKTKEKVDELCPGGYKGNRTVPGRWAGQESVEQEPIDTKEKLKKKRLCMWEIRSGKLIAFMPPAEIDPTPTALKSGMLATRPVKCTNQKFGFLGM